MSQTLEDRIKELERKLAVKNAYLTVQFSFPKNSKIPDDVKEQVINELKNACTALAEDETVAKDKDASIERLSDDDINILRQVAAAARGKISAAPQAQPAAPQPKQELPPKTFDSATDGVKKAILLTLENVDSKVRNRVSSQEQVYVTSERDGYARVTTRKGLSISVPIEDLEYETNV